MSERPEIVHDVADLKSDIEFEREELHGSIEHDYSTTIVPLTHRRPMWHFMGLWTTFVAGFSYMALGIEIYGGGYSLLKTVGVTVLGYAIYTCYAVFGSFLGSRTGQTHSLLTRSIFGSLRLGDRLALRPDRPARLGRLPGRPARAALGQLRRLGERRDADDHPRRRDDREQPLRLHRHQRLRPLPRHPGADRLGDLHGREGPHLRPRRPARLAARQPALLGRGRRGDRLRDVGQRARLLALRQAEARLVGPDLPVRDGVLPALHGRRLDDGAARRQRRPATTSASTTRSSARSGSPGSSPRSRSSRSTTATTTSRSTPART